MKKYKVEVLYSCGHLAEFWVEEIEDIEFTQCECGGQPFSYEILAVRTGRKVRKISFLPGDA